MPLLQIGKQRSSASGPLRRGSISDQMRKGTISALKRKGTVALLPGEALWDLHVQVVEGRYLWQGYKESRGDLFMEVNVRNVSQRTSPVADQRNPIWNERQDKLRFAVGSELEVLRLRLRLGLGIGFWNKIRPPPSPPHLYKSPCLLKGGHIPCHAQSLYMTIPPTTRCPELQP